MTDLENVIEHLKEIAEYFRGCRSNVSSASKAENHFWELQNAASEAAELLKEQEAVSVIQREVAHMLFWCCGSCGVAITEGDRFCRMCGKAVKWDD